MCFLRQFQEGRKRGREGERGREGDKKGGRERRREGGRRGGKRGRELGRKTEVRGTLRKGSSNRINTTASQGDTLRKKNN